jgi:hypothetical protein
MGQRIFQLRSLSHYQGDANEVTTLNIELLHDGVWEPFDLNVETAGFLIFVYAIFTCQHLYMRVNAAENGIVLNSAKGQIIVTTAEDWNLEGIEVAFECDMRLGNASPKTIAYIIERMKACPVSLNIRQDIEITARVTMHS